MYKSKRINKVLVDKFLCIHVVFPERKIYHPAGISDSLQFWLDLQFAAVIHEKLCLEAQVNEPFEWENDNYDIWLWLFIPKESVSQLFQ